MSRSVLKSQSGKFHPHYQPAIQMLRQKAHLLMEEAYDAECRGHASRNARFTAQASALSRAAGFLADCPQDPLGHEAHPEAAGD
ncbi:MAG: hypothetical protein RIS79_2224 [Verrucomicrobiota bacterium]|jgi:regulator of sirC expression with transglutaminase-like and TPR domain